MFTQLTAHDRPFTRTGALALAGGLFAAELALIGIIYKHAISFTCLDNWPAWACSGASGVLVSVYASAAALALYFILRPTPLRLVLADAGRAWRPLLWNLIGFAIALVPVGLLRDGGGTEALPMTFAFWSLGFTLLCLGLAGYVAPVARWRALFASDGLNLTLVTLAGISAPYLASLIRPLWRIDAITDATFQAVVWSIGALGYAVDADPETKIIGADGFYINIAPVCSGIEGIALVTIFVTLYLTLFRKELRFPLVLLLYPAGIAVSASLNIVRITVLLIIGLHGNPELAVGGFHSHAGWLMFTVIALGVVLVARSVPVLQVAPPQREGMPKQPSADVVPLLQDPNVARIMPFAIFMFSALLAQAFSQSPGLVYPLRALAMAAGLILFWRIYLALPWRPSRASLIAGAVIGAFWVLVPYAPADTAPSHGGLTGALLVGWLIVRGFGTIVLVPIIEELFFRDYLEGKLRGFAGPILAACVTAALFALLHNRWAEAFVAGLILSWVMSQRRQISDAIAAHGVANAIIYGVALATAQMHII